MTIALAIVVNDGIALATDSAATMHSQGPNNSIAVHNIYNSANKLFNLVKGKPIGGMVWGTGSIGAASMSSLVKEFRRRLTQESPTLPDWHLDLTVYTIEDVAVRLKRFLQERVDAVSPKPKPNGGFLVAGYSASSEVAETWLINATTEGYADPVPAHPGSLKPEASYACFYGQVEAIARLVCGVSTKTAVGLQERGVKPEEMAQWMQAIQKHTEAGLTHPAMPIQDAIDLAEFLAYVASEFCRFAPGVQTVGGPIDIAAVTKFEGFKWVKRKHYYPKKLNPFPHVHTG